MKKQTLLLLNALWILICLILCIVCMAMRGYSAIGGEGLIIAVPYIIYGFVDTDRLRRGKK